MGYTTVRPDPCLVSLVLNPPYFRRSRTERAWREARNCSRGCGVECKAMRERRIERMERELGIGDAL